MCVTFGVIFAQTGFFAALITQPQTSSRISGSSPIAAPILRSGKPCGQEKFNSNASTPQAWQRSTISIQASLRYSSMMDAMRTPSGNMSLHFLNSSSQILNGRSLMSSIFSQPMTSLPSLAMQFAVTRRDVDDFGRVEADGFGDDRAPAFLERLDDDVQIGSGRSGTDDEGIRQFQSVNGGG